MKVTTINRTRARLPAAHIRRDLQRASAAFSRTRTPALVTVVFVGDRESQRLNSRFRKKRHPADVLAFRYTGAGELVVAPFLIRRQARQRREPEGMLFRRLVIHGFLHLCGIHHESSVRADRRFGQLERRLLRRLGIS